MIVPAVTTSPSSNFDRANSLASASVAKVRVDRGLRLLTNVPRLGTSNVTYQVSVIHHGPEIMSTRTICCRRLALLDTALKRSFRGGRSVDSDQLQELRRNLSGLAESGEPQGSHDPRWQSQFSSTGLRSGCRRRRFRSCLI